MERRICRKSIKGYASNGEYLIIKQLKDMYSREKENVVMGLIDMKEKINKLGEFLKRNEKYVVEAYISNPVTNHIIGRMAITTDRTFKANDKGFTLEWDNSNDIKFNNLSVLYDEIMACYDETDEYEKQMIFVILKCGISIDFECCGLR